ncbi:methyltransferase [Mycolicibacillus parakoreensis]|uniref:Methyltransferase n=1 Tax=Mycolicibacillus parakoreensis TaxID=1069221 RepID=A0ABY3U6E4_9MYCO|nr:HemK2/MTQ2 family protein methyltransferase [Mycolicibacillus parakoreensis]ULN54680.2 methyltransferase [Mycolicibacillus parakoreensis]
MMLPDLTTCAPRSAARPRGAPPVADGVYVPQEDSQLLIGVMASMGLVHRKRVLDLCTGSGVVAIAAAELGARGVTAVDICPRAVRCAAANARAAGVDVDVRQGPWTHALTVAPFEAVVVNPPYVPTPPGAAPPAVVGSPARSWDGGVDGRAVLGPLCGSAGALLCPGGVLLMVQSEFADVDRSLLDLWAAGLSAEVVAEQRIPFGPVLSSRLDWLQRSGRMVPGCRSERLVVIRADKP